jgi:preprotein translocase subunit SecA
VQEEVSRIVAGHTPGPDPVDWDLRGLYHELRTFFPLPPGFNYREWENSLPAEIEESLALIAERAYDEIRRTIGHQMYRQLVQEDVTLEAMVQSADPTRRLIYQRLVEQTGKEPKGDVAARPLRRLSDDAKKEVEAAVVSAFGLVRDRQLMLRAVDSLWVRHLTDLSALREGIGLRAYGQQNPLVAYRKEAHEMYEALLAKIQETVVRSVYLVPQSMVSRPRRRQLRAVRPRAPVAGGAQVARPRSRPTPEPSDRKALGRNDPCWCGSGKKYKRCHLRQDEEQQRGPIASTRPPRTPSRRRRRR